MSKKVIWVLTILNVKREAKRQCAFTILKCSIPSSDGLRTDKKSSFDDIRAVVDVQLLRRLLWGC